GRARQAARGRRAQHATPLWRRTAEGAPRLRGGAPNDWGLGGHIVARIYGGRETEGRRGCAGAPRTTGGLGAISWPASTVGARQRGAAAAPGRPERLGAWGPYRGPHLQIDGKSGVARVRDVLRGGGGDLRHHRP